MNPLPTDKDGGIRIVSDQDHEQRGAIVYAIKGLCHCTDIDMGVHGFSIDLHPSTPEAVRKSTLTQDKLDRQLEVCGRLWLDAVGYDSIFDPDNCGFEKDEQLPPGSNVRPLYKPGLDLRVAWGEWGPEHITVPGNACGLDIDLKSFGCVFKGGASLHPHNVDSLRQKYLLLIVFTEIAYNITLFARNVALAPEQPRLGNPHGRLR